MPQVLTCEAMARYELEGWGFPRERSGFAAVGQIGPPPMACADLVAVAFRTTGLLKKEPFQDWVPSHEDRTTHVI